MPGKTEAGERKVRENEAVRWHRRFNGHELEHALGDGERQGSLVRFSPRGANSQMPLGTE